MPWHDNVMKWTGLSGHSPLISVEDRTQWRKIAGNSNFDSDPEFFLKESYQCGSGSGKRSLSCVWYEVKNTQNIGSQVQ